MVTQRLIVGFNFAGLYFVALGRKPMQLPTTKGNFLQLTPGEQRRAVVSGRILEAAATDVFDAFSNPDKIVRCWGPTGFTLRTESIELEEGGHWRFVFTGPDGIEYNNHLIFIKIEKPKLFVIDHMSAPKFIGTITFDDLGNKTRITMYQIFENNEVFARFRDIAIAGNEGNFDRLSDLVAGRR